MGHNFFRFILGPVWGLRKLFSHLNIFKYFLGSLSSKIFLVYFGRHMRTLSIRLHIVQIHWVYVYCTIFMQMLSIHIQFVSECLANVYDPSVFYVVFLCICRAYEYDSLAYAEHTYAICKRMLRICAQIVCTCVFFKKCRRVLMSKEIIWQNHFGYWMS